MIRVWMAAWLLLCACAWSAPTLAQTLRVELLATDGAVAGPPADAPVLAVARTGGAAGTAVLAPALRAGHHWLRLSSDRPIAAGDARLLVLDGPHVIGSVVWYPPLGAPRRVHESGRGGSGLLRRGWVLPLPQGWPAASVAYLRIGGGSTERVSLRLSTAAELAGEQRAQTRLITATFTALMLMALAVLVIGAQFRERMYLEYGGYLAGLALYSLLLSGDAAEMWGLARLDRLGVGLQWAIATLAVIAQLGFSIRLLELHQRLPNAARLLRGLQWAHVALLSTLLLGSRVHGWYYVVGNLLLALSAPTVLLVAAWAWRRGAAYGGYYLLGWAPLLAMLLVVVCHQLGLVHAAWAERLLPLLAVLESGVLVLALGQHASNSQRLALLARQAAERDPLTGALNRQALHRLLEGWQRMGVLAGKRYGLLRIDYDDLRRVNERQGRAVGDAVLQQVLARLRGVLRPEDVVARLDDDGFAVATECSAAECEQLASRLSAAVGARPLRIDGAPIAASVSIGLAMSQPGESVAALFARADRALQGARLGGHGAIGHAAAVEALAEP